MLEYQCASKTWNSKTGLRQGRLVRKSRYFSVKDLCVRNSETGERRGTGIVVTLYLESLQSVCKDLEVLFLVFIDFEGPSRTCKVAFKTQEISGTFKECGNLYWHFISDQFLFVERRESPWSIPCNELFTLQHILLHCMDFIDIRQKYFETIFCLQCCSTHNMSICVEDVLPVWRRSVIHHL